MLSNNVKDYCKLFFVCNANLVNKNFEIKRDEHSEIKSYLKTTEELLYFLYKSLSCFYYVQNEKTLNSFELTLLELFYQ